jgi:hypothetical protein
VSGGSVGCEEKLDVSRCGENYFLVPAETECIRVLSDN